MVRTKINNKRGNPPKTRKELRKEQRKMKKQRRLEYYVNRKKPGKFVLKPPDGILEEKQVTNGMNAKPSFKIKKIASETKTKFNKIEIEKNKQKKLEKEMQKHRKKQLIETNLEEDRNIRKLEKQLKLNKRKSQSISKSFVSDGLDYILEVCDSENRKSISIAEQELNDSSGGFDEDFALMTDHRIEKSGADEPNYNSESKDKLCDNPKNDDYLSENYDDSSSGSEKHENETFSDEESDHSFNDLNKEQAPRKRTSSTCINDPNKRQKHIVYSFNDESDVKDNEDIIDQNNSDNTCEDIYGRIKRKDGSLISHNNDKYIPPAIRAKMESELPSDKERVEKLIRLKKQIKGLFNRLAEANMHSISTQIEELYMNNSRNDMNATITNIMLDSLISNVITPERLLIEHVFLIIILHANIGTEVGAHFLHAVVKQFSTFFNSDHEVENKMLDNTINVIAQLYNFKLFHSKLLYELLSKLSSKFDEKSVECILSILKNVGFSLRKDDPLALKGLIIELQKQAANVPEEIKENLRIKYMLDILLAIKNNNMSKIPNYDTSYSEHLKKLQRNFIRKGNCVTQLNISLDDLIHADERGKWWIVGSAWSGVREENSDTSKVIKTQEYSQKLLNLARQQRMNTDTRRNIFCIIMSAEDYLDAFEKLLHLGLKNQQEREIIHVILHCCLQEKSFNPYYAILAQKFCEYDRKYQMIIKCSIWDKLKVLTDCSLSQLSNLAKLLTHLFLEKGLPISTLKIVQFGELDRTTLRFIRQILLGILLCEDIENCMAVFEKIAQSGKLKMFRESLRLFIHHFLLKNLKTENVPEDQKDLLKVRSDIIEKMLTVNDKKTRL